MLAGTLSALFPFVEEDVKRRLAERHFPTVEDLKIDVSSFALSFSKEPHTSLTTPDDCHQRPWRLGGVRTALRRSRHYQYLGRHLRCSSLLGARLLSHYGPLGSPAQNHKKKEALCLELGNKDGLSDRARRHDPDWGLKIVIDRAYARWSKQHCPP